MGVSLYDGVGSSVIATTKLGALQLLALQINGAESRKNRDNVNQQTAFSSFAITGDAQTLFTANIIIPAKMVEDAVTGDVDLVVQEPFDATYLPFTAAADLTGSGAMAAFLGLAKKCTYLEKQIDPNIVVQRADQVVITPDLENGQYTVALNLPVNISIDFATGITTYEPFDYLAILDFQV
jgi:hypothetical protein